MLDTWMVSLYVPAALAVVLTAIVITAELLFPDAGDGAANQVESLATLQFKVPVPQFVIVNV